MLHGLTAFILVVGSALILSTEAEAQYKQGPGGSVGMSFVAADAIGEFGLAVDHGFGLDLNAGIPMAADGHLRLRLDGGFMIYGIESFYYCDYGCRVGSELTTTNSILYGGVGPEIVFARGDIQPYVHATAGMSWFVASSAVDHHAGYGSSLDTTNYSDHVFGWKFGGGLRVRAGNALFINLGVVRHDNGLVSYLTEGDIVDNPDGSVTMYPKLSEAELLSFQLGVTLGLF
ncbi:MAG: hypothetical protein OSA81_08130 [Longimicrobiales bacterium]|nr:hypothetical protein [Longimicrobiales bacterium]